MSIFFALASFQAASRLLLGCFQAYSRLWLEYGYSMAGVRLKHGTKNTQSSLALLSPLANPRQAQRVCLDLRRVCLGYAKGLPKACLGYAKSVWVGATQNSQKLLTKFSKVFREAEPVLARLGRRSGIGVKS